jgi:hypothetical protein
MIASEPPTIPPGGWYYEQPETRFRFEAVTLADLVVKVDDHRTANGLALVDTRNDIVAFTLRRVPGYRPDV